MNQKERLEIHDILIKQKIDAIRNNTIADMAHCFFEQGMHFNNANFSQNMAFWSFQQLTFQDWQKLQEQYFYRQGSLPSDIDWDTIFVIDTIQIDHNAAFVILDTQQEAAKYSWQPKRTLYYLNKIDLDWKITAIVDNLPRSFQQEAAIAQKLLPKTATQHSTAGPYSPVLEVVAPKIVVISGQAPINQEGKVIGDNIEDQTHFMMENCQKQLNTGGVDFKDVFKVNVYLTDLDLWPRFNQVYQTYMPQPYPARTAVQSGLLYTFLVEIEMWAVKNI